MKITAAQLAGLLQGNVEGDGSVEISGPSQIDKGVPGTVTFLANPKYEEFAYNTEASVIIVSHDFVPREPVHKTLIRVSNVYGAMMFLAEQFSKNFLPESGISSMAFMDSSVKVGEKVTVGPYAVIEAGSVIGDNVIIFPQVYVGKNVTIKEGSIIYAGARIYSNCEIGASCIVHANAVIGSDGFGYRPDEKGKYHKIPHIGKVVLEDDVEIGANATIDRGTLQETRIRSGAKIDNLVMIAHNVVIGENTVIAAQSGIAGSSSVGKQARIGGQVGISGHINIPDGVEIQAQSGIISSNLEPNEKIFGSPAIGYANYLKSYAVFKQLPDLLKRIAALERELKDKK